MSRWRFQERKRRQSESVLRVVAKYESGKRVNAFAEAEGKNVEGGHVKIT